MPITLVGTEVTFVNSGGSPAVSVPAGTQEDDVMILLAATDDGDEALTLPAGFTQVFSGPAKKDAAGSTLDTYVVLGYRVATSSEPASYTVDHVNDGEPGLGCMAVYRGVDVSGANPWDATPVTREGYEDDLPPWIAASITTNTAGAVVLCCFGNELESVVVTPETGFTMDVSAKCDSGFITSGASVHIGRREYATAGATGDMEFTGEDEFGDSYIAITLALLPASSGGSTGSGTLDAGTSTSSGSGGVATDGTGGVAAAAPTMSASMTASHAAVGALSAALAVASGVGAVEPPIDGAGALQADTATAFGTAQPTITGAGAMQAGTATADGAGTQLSTITLQDVLDIVNAKNSGFVLQIRPENLWQNNDKTSPVTADGQLAAYIVDKSVHGWDFADLSTQIFAPIYRTNGTQHWLEFGNLGGLVSVYSGTTEVADVFAQGPYSVSAAFDFDKVSEQYLFATSVPDGTSTSGRDDNIAHVGSRSANRFTVGHWFNDANFEVTHDYALHTYTGRYNAPGSEFFIDGLLIGENTTLPSVLGTSFTRATIMCRIPVYDVDFVPSGTPGDAFGMVGVINDTVTEYEQGIIDNWLGTESGLIEFKDTSPTDLVITLEADQATMTGAAGVETTAGGTPQALTATLAGEGTVSMEYDGTGAVAASKVALAGEGAVVTGGSGAMQAETASTAGAGVAAYHASGALAAGEAMVDADALYGFEFAAEVAAGPVSMAMVSEVLVSGTGALEAAAADMDVYLWDNAGSAAGGWSASSAASGEWTPVDRSDTTFE